MFVCSLCGNSDEKYIGNRKGKLYCRRCISFIGEREDDDSFYALKESKAFINYPLSQKQIEISNEVVKNYKNHKNTLINAVCGAGKTELILKVIEYALKHKQKVGFSIPRKDVVIEISRRLQFIFKNNVVTSVYGGNTTLLVGDIICLTTHQLYRYNKYFDLLILDEIDAFPYKGNEVLNALFKRSVKGNYVLMSATPSKEILEEFKNNGDSILFLYTRYHKKPIPVPQIKIFVFFTKYIYLVYKLKKFIDENKPTLVFAPTIALSESLFSFLHLFFKEGEVVNSKKENRQKIIDKFRANKYKYLVTTAVLERGVTLKNLQVIIFNADHKIYNKDALIQISGRVGRVIGYEKGEVIYVSERKTKAMEEAINSTINANKNL